MYIYDYIWYNYLQKSNQPVSRTILFSSILYTAENAPAINLAKLYEVQHPGLPSPWVSSLPLGHIRSKDHLPGARYNALLRCPKI